MALDWLTVLKTVPWGNVIETAPKVAQGARALWQRVGAERHAAQAPASPAAQPPADVAALAAQLADQLAAQQRQIDSLREDLAQAGGLIDALAQQQRAMAEQVQRQGRWLRALGGLTVLALGLACAALLRPLG